MKKSKFNSIPLFILLIFLFSNCSNEESNQPAFLDVIGVVDGPTSCGGPNGNAYRILLGNFDKTDFIITGVLPEGFKEQGLEIMFDMSPSMEGIDICTANFSEQVFYEVIGVKLSQ